MVTKGEVDVTFTSIEDAFSPTGVFCVSHVGETRLGSSAPVIFHFTLINHSRRPFHVDNVAVSGSFHAPSITTATLLSVAALQVYFRCNDERAERSQHQDFVDPRTGTRVVEVELNVTRNEVEEYFGKERFKCECVAWSGPGQIRGQPATVEVACK